MDPKLRVKLYDPTVSFVNTDHLLERKVFLEGNFNDYSINDFDLSMQGRNAYITTKVTPVIHKLFGDECSKVLELLPGDAEELSLAFALMGYKGRYDKLDLFNFFGESKILELRSRFMKFGFRSDSELLTTDVFLWAENSTNIQYDAIVAKHPFDDLFIGLYGIENGISSNSYFTDPIECRKHWDKAIYNFEKYTSKIKKLASDLSLKVKEGGYFLTVNHPDTFSTNNGMTDRTFITSYVRNIFNYSLLKSGFEFISNEEIDEYNNSTYPNSLIVLRKAKNITKIKNQNVSNLISAYLDKQAIQSIHPKVFAVLSYYGHVEEWFENDGNDKAHAEIVVLLNLLLSKSSTSKYRKEVEIFVKKVLEYYRLGVELEFELVKELERYLNLLSINCEGLEVFTTLEPCKSRRSTLSCSSILKSLGIRYTYGCSDDVYQSSRDILFTADTFINFNKLHFIALYFLSKKEINYVSGGDIFVKNDVLEFKYAFSGHNGLKGLKDGLLFANLNYLKISDIREYIIKNNIEPYEVILNVNNDNTYTEEISDLEKEYKVSVVTYY